MPKPEIMAPTVKEANELVEAFADTIKHGLGPFTESVRFYMSEPFFLEFQSVPTEPNETVEKWTVGSWGLVVITETTFSFDRIRGLERQSDRIDISEVEIFPHDGMRTRWSFWLTARLPDEAW